MEDKFNESNIENEIPTTRGDADCDVCGSTTDPEIDILKQNVTELSDKYLRTAAELENTRRRAVLDGENIARSRSISLLENFLPVIDAIDSALKHTPEDPGIIAMANAVHSAFLKSGIRKIESMDQMLNPTFHNAVSTESKTDTVPNMITNELQSGYVFGDTVLRPAMVVVAK